MGAKSTPTVEMRLVVSRSAALGEVAWVAPEARGGALPTFAADLFALGAITRALLGVTTPPWAAAYLAHLTLRQVEWVRRFYPGTDEHDRFVSIGRAVLDDVEVLLA